MSKLTDEVKYFIDRCFDDRIFAIENLIWITDKNGKKRNLVMWEGQSKFIRWKRYCAEQEGLWTLLVVKLRQGGITTVSIADSLLDCIMSQGQDHMFLCKAGEDKEALFDRVKLMDAQLPNEFKLQKVRDQSTAIKYELPHGSSVRILESGVSERESKKKGRSATSQYLHVTEAGYIEHLSQLMQGAKGSVSPNGCICCESTPAGAQGYLYSLSSSVIANGKQIEPNVWKHGKTILLFLPYYEHPEYQSGNDLTGDLDEREQRLRDIGAPDSAIQWRREWLENAVVDDRTGTTPIEMFDREYPSEIMDGFRATGRGFFALNVIQAMQTLYQNKKGLRIGLGANGTPCQPSGFNDFVIFAPPVEGYKNRYSIFMDCAEGLPTSDLDVIYVFDRKLRIICAVHCGKYGAQKQVDACEVLAEYYQNAWVSHDRTGIGADRVPLLAQSEIENIYYKDLENPKIEDMGLKWNVDNRRVALSELKTCLEKLEWTLPDCEAWKEAEHFAYPENGGSPCASGGFKDDRIMALAGLAWMESRLPPVQKIEAKSNNRHDSSLISRFNKSGNSNSIGNY